MARPSPTRATAGLLAGLTATGGGVLLTPLPIFMRGASTRTASAVSAPFILWKLVAILAENIEAARTVHAFALTPAWLPSSWTSSGRTMAPDGCRIA